MNMYYITVTFPGDRAPIYQTIYTIHTTHELERTLRVLYPDAMSITLEVFVHGSSVEDCAMRWTYHETLP